MERDEELEQIRQAMLDRARIIEAPERDLPTIGSSEESGRPSIESRPLGRAYVIRERGHLFSERVAATDDELLYWVFRSVTQSMATRWELHHRIPGHDSRRDWMPIQLALMGRLSPAWEARLRQEDAAIYAEVGIT